MHIIYDPAMALLGTESQDFLAHVQQNIWSGTFLASLGIIAKMLKTTECSTHISMHDSYNLMLSEKASYKRINAVRK